MRRKRTQGRRARNRHCGGAERDGQHCNLAVSHMANNSVNVTDLETGAQRIVSHPLMIEPTYNNHSAILEDCSGFIAVVKSASPDLWDIAEFHFDGQATILWAAQTLPTKLVVIDDGTALVMDNFSVANARTHEVIVDYGEHRCRACRRTRRIFQSA